MTARSSGVLYIATGERYVREAEASARSLAAVEAGLPVALLTDSSASVTAGLFDLVLPFPGPATRTFRDKIVGLAASPYDDTLFLDGDTHVARPVQPVLDLLDHHDLAVSHDTWRLGVPVPVPDSFPELNTGVLAYRRGAAVDALFRRWLERYDEMAGEHPELLRGPQPLNDQPPFRWALYESDVRVATLTTEWNYRLWCPGFAGEGAEVAILHGRHGDLPMIARQLNETRRVRVSLPGTGWLRADSVVITTGGGPKLMTLVGRLVGAAQRCRTAFPRARR